MLNSFNPAFTVYIIFFDLIATLLFKINTKLFNDKKVSMYMIMKV